MPVMDGWQFLDRFTQIPTQKKIAIYIVTSSIDESDLEKAKTYEKVTNYVVKPISIEKLQEILLDFQ
jgi:CheY-like chemotaxis protein